MSLTSTTYAELAAATNGPGTGGFDLTIAAQVGDDIEAGFHCNLNSAAVETIFDVATMVSGSPVNYMMGGSSITFHGWYANGGVNVSLGEPAHYTVQAGDLAGGLITLRPYYIDSVATARVVLTNVTSRFEFYAKNIGPADAT